MPLEVKVESERLLQQFADVQARITDLNQKLPEVFIDWQRDDMHRKYPHIDEQSGSSVTTLVFPRSRRVRPLHVNSGKKTDRKASRRVVGVTRPILRPELVEQLFDRMKTMCREALEWQ